MIPKELEFLVNAPYEEVWNKTLWFWERKRYKIRNPAYSNDDQSRIVDILKPAGMSTLIKTLVSSGCAGILKNSISYLSPQVVRQNGFGPTWYMPSKKLKEWALLVNTIPQEFAKGAFYGWFIGWSLCFLIFTIIVVVIISSLTYYPY